MKRVLTVLLASAWLCAGCAALAAKSDYADYRAVRTERSDEARLRAMQRYVARHPDGRWHAEIQRERAAREREVFESGRSHRAGLELYLSAFPDGAFAAQARSRLEAIAVIEQRKRDEAERAVRLTAERHVRDEELSRTWVTRFFGYWIETLLALEGWGSPIEQVARGNAEFARAFGRPPRPRCTLEECVKSYASAYAVPVPGGTRLERAMRLSLRLRMDAGKLQRAELLLPSSGFSRWQELEDKRVVVDGDPEARAQALEWAMGRVLPLLDQFAAGHQPIEGYALPPIAQLGTAGTGELTDTTAADPSAPQNRIQGSAAAEPEPPKEQVLAPTAPEPAADLEMDTLRVDREGRAQPEAAPEPELVLDPMVVPQAGAAAAPSPASPAQPFVRAFRAGDLRIVVFAASATDPNGLDGVLIERVAPAPKPKAPARAAAPRGAGRTPPPAAPAKAGPH